MNILSTIATVLKFALLICSLILMGAAIGSFIAAVVISNGPALVLAFASAMVSMAMFVGADSLDG